MAVPGDDDNAGDAVAAADAAEPTPAPTRSEIVVAPGAPANTLQALNNRSRIQLDDGSSVQTPLPLPPYLGVDNTLRSGDTVGGVAAVMSESFGSYELHPTAAVNFTRVNDRPDTPDVGGSMTVAAYNVLNYFTTIDNAGPVCGPLGNQGCRGADTADELDRQRDKIVAALAELDADVVGLMEIENPRIAAAPVDAAIEDLVASLNLAVGAGTYEYIDTGTIGGATGDAIKVALIASLTFVSFTVAGGPHTVPIETVPYACMMLRELLIGFFLGFLLQIVMLAVRVAGTMVGHEMGFAMAVADRVILFDEGELVEQNTPAEFFENPQHDRTKLFLKQIL